MNLKFDNQFQRDLQDTVSRYIYPVVTPQKVWVYKKNTLVFTFLKMEARFSLDFFNNPSDKNVHVSLISKNALASEAFLNTFHAEDIISENMQYRVVLGSMPIQRILQLMPILSMCINHLGTTLRLQQAVDSKKMTFPEIDTSCEFKTLNKQNQFLSLKSLIVEAETHGERKTEVCISSSNIQDNSSKDASLSNHLINAKHIEVLRKIKADLRAGRKLKIGFMVSDQSKWAYGELIRLIDNDIDFENRVELEIFLVNKREYNNENDNYNEYYREKRFFDSLEIPVIEGYDFKNKQHFDFKVQNYHLIFFQQPWGMSNVPYRALGFSLCLYLHYSYLLTYNPKIHYGLSKFHPYLFKYFCTSELHRELHLKVKPEQFDIPYTVGYPKFDALASINIKSGAQYWTGAKNRVIYAPHHSIGDKCQARLSTFDWTHSILMGFLETSADTDWVYKPHGKLRSVVQARGVMTTEEYDKYVYEWESRANSTVCFSGDYLPIFATSTAMITDCGSFLAEYLFSENPIIRLVSSNDPVKFNEVGLAISSVCYNVHNEEELRDVFHQVVIMGEDPLRAKRIDLKNNLFPENNHATANIVDFIKRKFLE